MLGNSASPGAASNSQSPLPTPWRVTRSASQMRKAVPAISVSVVPARKAKPGSSTKLATSSSPSAMPEALECREAERREPREAIETRAVRLGPHSKAWKDDLPEFREQKRTEQGKDAEREDRDAFDCRLGVAAAEE